jgi:hypothetical protein
MKQPKQNKAVQAARSKKKVACPTRGVLYAPGTGLAAHIRSKHGNAPQAIPVAGNKAPAAEAAIQMTVVDVDPRTHLQTALDQLTARNNQIDQELGRAEGLQTEKRQVTQRIEALTAAMKAFGQESMAASG